MPSFAFIEAGYQTRGLAADCQRWLNLYIERNQSGAGANHDTQYSAYNTPGKTLLVTLGDSPVACVVSSNSGLPIDSTTPLFFAIAGQTLYYITAVFTAGNWVGTANTIGTVTKQAITGTGGQLFPAQIIVINPNLLFVVTAGSAWVASFSGTWTVTQQEIPAGSGLGVNYISTATWMDGYVIVSMAQNATDPQRRQFFISALNDPTTWSALDFATKEANSDPIVAVFAAYEILGLFGTQTIELWQDSGNVLFPFQRVPGGGVIENGLASAAATAVCKMDGTVVWLGSDARGQYIAWQLRGNTPVRISNHAIENAWSLYDTAGASVYSYMENGHFFACFHFPIPDKTWVWDSTIGPEIGWHERAFWDGSSFHADIGRYHAFYPEIGHCVGDYRNGNLYLQGLQYLQDNCQNITRIRVAPHLVNEKKRNFYTRFRLHSLTGRVPATGSGSNPSCNLRISNDGGQTFGNYLPMNMGAIGAYKQLIEWYHLGYARDRVYEWSCTDPVDIVLVDAYGEYVPGFN